jgi:integrase
MPKRFQKGNVKKIHRPAGWMWVGQWWEDGHRRNRKLGLVSKMTKTQAEVKLAEILGPINAAKAPVTEETSFGDFVRNKVFRFLRRKWKASTRGTTEDRIRFHLIEPFEKRTIGSFDRDELQDLLDAKAKELSFSTVDHLRWDLHQIFEFAVSEGAIKRNPAELLFTPREAKPKVARVMSPEEVKKLFEPFEVRERVVLKLALIAGMRPGEIFALTRGNGSASYADVAQRVYRGVVDKPKTRKSVRQVAFSEGVLEDLLAWLSVTPETGATGWLFPSETFKTAFRPDNFWRRYVRPKLIPIGLGWVNFQVIRA